jgi:hypothetical protein
VIHYFWLLILVFWAAAAVATAINPGRGLWSLTGRPLRPRSWQAHLIYLTPLACLPLLACFVWAEHLQSPSESAVELTGAWGVGALWLAAIGRLPIWLGIGFREVSERGNYAVAWARGGAQIGLTLCFGFAYLRTPVDMETVPALFIAAGATGVLLACWTLFEWWTRVSDAITIEREGGAALRLAAFVIVEGLLLGDAIGRLPWLRPTDGGWLNRCAPLLIFVLSLGIEEICRRRPGPPCSSPQRRDGFVALLIIVVGTGLYLGSR